MVEVVDEAAGAAAGAEVLVLLLSLEALLLVEEELSPEPEGFFALE